MGNKIIYIPYIYKSEPKFNKYFKNGVKNADVSTILQIFGIFFVRDDQSMEVYWCIYQTLACPNQKILPNCQSATRLKSRRDINLNTFHWLQLTFTSIATKEMYAAVTFAPSGDSP